MKDGLKETQNLIITRGKLAALDGSAYLINAMKCTFELKIRVV